MDEGTRAYFLDLAPSKNTVHRWIRGGALRRVQIGKQRMFVTEIEIQNLEAALREGHVQGYELPAKHRK